MARFFARFAADIFLALKNPTAENAADISGSRFRPDLNGARSHKQHKQSIFGATEKHRNWQQAQTELASALIEF